MCTARREAIPRHLLAATLVALGVGCTTGDKDARTAVPTSSQGPAPTTSDTSNARAPTADPSGAASAQPSAPSGAAQTVTIASNTQATIGDVRIGAGNFWDDDFTDDKGNKRKGPTAGLWIYFREDKASDTKRRVHTGESFVAGRTRFEIVTVEPTQVTVRVGPATP